MNEYPQQRTFWQSAIDTRRSVRSYQDKALSHSDIKKLRAFTDSIDIPFVKPVELRYFKADPTRPLANNLRTPPPDNIAFLADTDLLSVASVGFIGELVILYATGLGLGTCWFGHYLLPELERLMPHLPQTAKADMPKFGYGKGEPEGKRAVCITPLGYFKGEGLRLVDRLTENMMSYRRKPLNERLVGGMTEEKLPTELVTALKLAVKAPSAGNTQHWEITVSPDCKMVKIALPVGFKHFKWEHPDVCVGACAAHFWLGLQMQGVPVSVVLFEEQGRAVWEFKL